MSVGKLVSAATLGVLVAFGTAQGADLYGGYGGYKDEPPVRAFTWQGFYLGAYWGWAWSSIDAANNAVLLTNQGSMPFGSPSSSGLLGGAEFGYNVQSGNFVYGIEVDLGGLDTGASGSYTDPNNTNRTIFVKSAGGFYGDITGRLGLTFGNALIYAKGGFALFTGNVRVTDALDGINQDSGTFTGWTIGGGVEYQLTPNLSLKVEYQYLDLDNENFSCCFSSSGHLDDNISSNMVKVGVNYFLHGVRSPLN